MKVVVQASKTFEDYNVFMRAMAVALSSLKGTEDSITFYSAGPHKINSFLTGFVNLSEDGMKNRGMSIKMYKVPHSWVENNIDEIDYFVYLSNHNEKPSRLANMADVRGTEVGLFRY